MKDILLKENYYEECVAGVIPAINPETFCYSLREGSRPANFKNDTMKSG